jgi:5'-3' exonuclease
LLCGIEHDGKEGQWTFTRFHLVDLSTLRVRLKAEFQASNAELYPKK